MGWILGQGVASLGVMTLVPCSTVFRLRVEEDCQGRLRILTLLVSPLLLLLLLLLIYVMLYSVILCHTVCFILYYIILCSCFELESCLLISVNAAFHVALASHGRTSQHQEK